MKKINSFAVPAVLGIILIGSFALMITSSLQESAIMDELAHIPAGYGYVKYLDFRLNPEHPPLVKALAAFPLIFQNLNFPTDSSYWLKDINGQWAVGSQFLYEYKNDADQIIDWARVGPMILTIILILFVYIWAKELLGKWWALVPTILVAFSPAILAHGHYVTTDIGASLGIFISTYYFVRFLQNKSKKNLIVAGLAFGIAQLMKFSAVLLLPLFVFLVLMFAVAKSRTEQPWGAAMILFFKNLARYAWYLILTVLIGYLVVYTMYFAFTVNYPVEKQVSDTTYILSSFAGGPDQNLQACNPGSGVSLSRRMRCLADLNIWMAGNKILRPLGQYMLGVLMVVQRSSGGNTSYFLGEVSSSGWWYYFPVVFALKEPIPSLILIALAIFLAALKFAGNFRKSSLKERFFNYLELNFAEFSMASFVVLYWAYSIKSPLNIGIRHILPTVPFIYILSTEVIKNWVRAKVNMAESFIKSIFHVSLAIIKTSLKSALIIALLAWYLLETFTSAPYFISYFNEFGGGLFNGYQYVTDSNYDWGQDLRRLEKFVANPPAGVKIDKIAVDYFGGGSPRYYLGDKFEPWWSSRNNPKYQGIEWFAISINNLQGAIEKLHPGQERKAEDEYSWLTKIKDPHNPDYRIGTSIFVFKLD